ncbi:hypothetical protein D9M73_245110 [compost metagenome]
MQKLNSKKPMTTLNVKLTPMQKLSSKKLLTMLNVKLKQRLKQKLHLLKKHKKRQLKRKLRLKKLLLQLDVILSKKFDALGMFRRAVVVKQLVFVLPSQIREVSIQL